MALFLIICEITCDLTDVSASIYDRKTTARRFDTIPDILPPLSSKQSVLKGQNVPIWRIRNRGVKYVSMIHSCGFVRTKLCRRMFWSLWLAQINSKLDWVCPRFSYLTFNLHYFYKRRVWNNGSEILMIIMYLTHSIWPMLNIFKYDINKTLRVVDWGMKRKLKL